MDIGAGRGYPSSSLSNFHPRHFVFDGVECSSIEGLLQSFKFDKPHIQTEVCKLVGLTAKRRGQKRNKAWKRIQKLWWNGKEYDRHGEEYQQLLDRLYDAVAEQSESFRRALLATGNSALTHSVGRNDPSQTVLTSREFCSRLEKIRARVRNT